MIGSEAQASPGVALKGRTFDVRDLTAQPADAARDEERRPANPGLLVTAESARPDRSDFYALKKPLGERRAGP